MTKKRYTVTSALPYANGPLHIGHIAGAYLPADIYVRYRKSKQDDVLFVCGSDEHGAAITLRAKKEGLSPQEIVDTYHQLNKQSFADFGINFDIYHRTSDPLHHQTAQEFFEVLHEKGVFTESVSQQFFDEEHQQFLADRYIVGTCPKCGSDNAYGDQCEKCGSALIPIELINPKSTLSGNVPVMKETKHWYLPMQEHEDCLIDWIENGVFNGKQRHNPKHWRSQVIGQCKSWIDGGLRERAMTRDLDWGVKVPVEGADGKVLYVWLDAPIGYISATKQWALDNNKNWQDYWQNDAELIHFIAIKKGTKVKVPRFGVDEDVCTGDHACMRLSGCPSLSLKHTGDPLRDDPVAHIDQTCVGCGNCGEVAEAAVLCPSFYQADVVHNPSAIERWRAKFSQTIIDWLKGYRDRHSLRFQGMSK